MFLNPTFPGNRIRLPRTLASWKTVRRVMSRKPSGFQLLSCTQVIRETDAQSAPSYPPGQPFSGTKPTAKSPRCHVHPGCSFRRHAIPQSGKLRRPSPPESALSNSLSASYEHILTVSNLPAIFGVFSPEAFAWVDFGRTFGSAVAFF